ncbi:hypothetical protein FTX61_13240 [Nitriliruptoraceae bacterium ZYF776]|nr:hypothetical protein [Profundirhabdus halotolerans]
MRLEEGHVVTRGHPVEVGLRELLQILGGDAGRRCWRADVRSLLRSPHRRCAPSVLLTRAPGGDRSVRPVAAAVSPTPSRPGGASTGSPWASLPVSPTVVDGGRGSRVPAGRDRYPAVDAVPRPVVVT